MCVCVATRCFFVVDCTSSIFIVAGNRGVSLEVPRTIPREEKGASKRLEVSRLRSRRFRLPLKLPQKLTDEIQDLRLQAQVFFHRSVAFYLPRGGSFLIDAEERASLSAGTSNGTAERFSSLARTYDTRKGSSSDLPSSRNRKHTRPSYDRRDARRVRRSGGCPRRRCRLTSPGFAPARARRRQARCDPPRDRASPPSARRGRRLPPQTTPIPACEARAPRGSAPPIASSRSRFAGVRRAEHIFSTLSRSASLASPRNAR